MSTEKNDKLIRAAASRMYCSGTIDFEPNAEVSDTCDETGFWVAALVWVPREEFTTQVSLEAHGRGYQEGLAAGRRKG